MIPCMHALHWLTQTHSGVIVALILGMVFLLVLYLIPGLLAYSLGCRNWRGILVLNLLLGWTVIGWLVMLIWALVSEDAPRFDDDDDQYPPSTKPRRLPPTWD